MTGFAGPKASMPLVIVECPKTVDPDGATSPPRAPEAEPVGVEAEEGSPPTRAEWVEDPTDRRGCL